jgi:hypothetical protein
VFEDYCQQHKPDDESAVFNGALMVFADQLSMLNGKNTFRAITSNSLKHHFWSTMGEDDVSGDKHITSQGGGRFNPVLKLYPKCPLMLTMNKNVSCGKANGSRLLLEHVCVKVGEQPMLVKMECGTIIRAFTASQIKHLTVRHESSDIEPPTFCVQSQTFKFKTTLAMGDHKHKVHMEANQMPLVSNSATTGHKLQGYTAKELLVNNFNYATHWAYVVLSRVRTMAGLFL